VKVGDDVVGSGRANDRDRPDAVWLGPTLRLTAAVLRDRGERGLVVVALTTTLEQRLR
jgi:hypothetical protein